MRRGMVEEEDSLAHKLLSSLLMSCFVGAKTDPSLIYLPVASVGQMPQIKDLQYLLEAGNDNSAGA